MCIRSSSSIAISGKGFESKLKPYVKRNLKFNYLPNWADDFNMDDEPIGLSRIGKDNYRTIERKINMGGYDD